MCLEIEGNKYTSTGNIVALNWTTGTTRILCLLDKQTMKHTTFTRSMNLTSKFWKLEPSQSMSQSDFIKFSNQSTNTCITGMQCQLYVAFLALARRARILIIRQTSCTTIMSVYSSPPNRCCDMAFVIYKNTSEMPCRNATVEKSHYQVLPVSVKWYKPRCCTNKQPHEEAGFDIEISQ